MKNTINLIYIYYNLKINNNNINSQNPIIINISIVLFDTLNIIKIRIIQLLTIQTIDGKVNVCLSIVYLLGQTSLDSFKN